ncbi:MAG: hypothetical protein GY738_08545 [Pseudoalteromonas sp.]|nr:hypothetical protein [Pseudoalteromonas sp.]
MTKPKTVGIPEWFSLENYRELNKLNDDAIWNQLYQRQVLLYGISANETQLDWLCDSYVIGNFKIRKDIVSHPHFQQITAGLPIVVDANTLVEQIPYTEAEISQLMEGIKRDRNALLPPQLFKLLSSNTTVKQKQYIQSIIPHDFHVVAYERNLASGRASYENRDFNHLNTKLLDIEELTRINRLTELSGFEKSINSYEYSNNQRIQPDLIGTIFSLSSGGKNIHLTLDLSRPDNELLEDIATLLPKIRETCRESAKQIVYERADDVAKLRDYQLIALLDLLIWSNYTGQTIKPKQLVLALYPDGKLDAAGLDKTAKKRLIGYLQYNYSLQNR